MGEPARWPKWVKVPTVDGYGVEPQDRRIKTDMEIGSVYRVEFDTDETIASCSVFLDPLQANWFEGFERDLLSQGSVWFTMPLWVAGGLVDHTVRFRDRPKLTEKAGRYSLYSFSLDLARREGVMPKALVGLLGYVDPNDFISAEGLLRKAVNDDYPEAMPFAA